LFLFCLFSKQSRETGNMGYTRRRQTKQKQFRETGNMGYTSFSGLFLFYLSLSCVPYLTSFSGLFLLCLSSSCVPHVTKQSRETGQRGYTRQRQTKQKQSRETGNMGYTR
jgi:hypothetical protein